MKSSRRGQRNCALLLGPSKPSGWLELRGEAGALRARRMGPDLTRFQGSLELMLGYWGALQRFRAGGGGVTGSRGHPSPAAAWRMGLRQGRDVLPCSRVPGMAVGPGVRGRRAGSRLW